jgi:hypothetical protein
MSDARGTAKVLLHQNREPGRNFALYRADDRQTFYADGIAGIVGSANVTHLEFFVVTDSEVDNDPNMGFRETREVKLRVTMPTLQFLEGYANLLSMIQGNLDGIAAATDQLTRATAEQIARVRAIRAE